MRSDFCHQDYYSWAAKARLPLGSLLSKFPSVPPSSYPLYSLRSLHNSGDLRNEKKDVWLGREEDFKLIKSLTDIGSPFIPRQPRRSQRAQCHDLASLRTRCWTLDPWTGWWFVSTNHTYNGFLFSSCRIRHRIKVKRFCCYYSF